MDAEGLAELLHERPLDSILVGVDNSSSAMAAIEFATDLAAEHGAQLIFVHVAPLLDLTTVDIDDSQVAFPHEPTMSDRLPLADAAAAAAARGVVAKTELLGGSAAEELVEYAETCAVDLIVIGSSGHGTLSGVLTRSVSRVVLRKATRPVFVVRPGMQPPTE
jgi:nucleotide-binding universal stress UspA family protein